jgi:hypothetical protein
MSKQPEQITEAAQGKIDEEILGAAWANPRGSMTASVGAGVAVSEIGGRWMGKQRGGAEGAGIELGKPGALVITPTSLITMKVKVSATGQIKEIEQLLSAVPLDAIDEFEVKRAGLTGVLRVAVGESSFKLEGKVGDLRDLVDAFERAKATAG